MDLLHSELCQVDLLLPYANNARTHSAAQIEQLAQSIRSFGFTNPILVSDDLQILAGHGRVLAAKKIGLEEVPVIRLSHLDDQQRRAYVLADNKLAQNAGWDDDLLKVELQALEEVEFDLGVIGFSTAELDILFEQDDENQAPAEDLGVPTVDPANCISKRGDVWLMGKHRLLCGDALSSQDVLKLCSKDDGEVEQISLLFTDPPYNVPIDGHVSGLGNVKHREFIQGSGELNSEQFEAFLTQSLRNAASVMKDGAIAYICMDWRHIQECVGAGHTVFDQLKNLCVWNKSNAGMGSFYRSKHELIFVFKKGTQPHTNNFLLGEAGRHRTNVWDYAGMSSISGDRSKELAMHPTVKPVAMIADAMRDCSHRAELVLDVFGGSGSTLIAAEQCGRRARIVELDPIYCDVIIKRFQETTGQSAMLQGTGHSYQQAKKMRQSHP